AKTRGTALLLHSGCPVTKARNWALVTGVTSSSNDSTWASSSPSTGKSSATSPPATCTVCPETVAASAAAALTGALMATRASRAVVTRWRDMSGSSSVPTLSVAGRGVGVVGADVDALGEDHVVLLAGHYQRADGALVEGPEDRVVDECEGGGHVGLELHHRGAAGGDHGGLDVPVDHRATLEPDTVEDVADDVDAAGQVGAAVADEEPDGLPDLGLEGVVARERADAAVEDHVGGVLVYGAHHVEVLQALLAEVALGVEVALHHVVLAVHRREAFLGFDDDEAVHTVRDVHAYRRRGAVVDVHARVEGGEAERRLLPRGDERRLGTAALAAHGVQVDVVGHQAGGVVLQREGDEVALAHPDHGAGDAAAEGPEAVLDAVGELHDLFTGLEFDLDVGAVVAVHGRGGVGCETEDALDDRQVRHGDLVLVVGPQGAFGPGRVDGQVVYGVLVRGVGQRVLDGGVRDRWRARLTGPATEEGQPDGDDDHQGRGPDDRPYVQVASEVPHLLPPMPALGPLSLRSPGHGRTAVTRTSVSRLGVRVQRRYGTDVQRLPTWRAPPAAVREPR